jgi:hypothetical protein
MFNHNVYIFVYTRVCLFYIHTGTLVYSWILHIQFRVEHRCMLTQTGKMCLVCTLTKSDLVGTHTELHVKLFIDMQTQNTAVLYTSFSNKH